MKKILVSIVSILAVIFILCMWWRYTYCREIPLFEDKEDKYEITSLMYRGKDKDIKDIDTDAIDKLLCDAKGTRTYHSFYPYEEKNIRWI